jgi:hypothetical protein
MARVLVIRQHYFPLDIRVRREVEALRSAGHEVDVICVARSGERWRERWGGVRIVRIPFDLRHGGSVSYILKYGVFAVVAGMLAAALHLRRRYGLVQVNSLPDTLVFSALVPRLLGARVLLDLHETMPEFSPPDSGRRPMRQSYVSSRRPSRRRSVLLRTSSPARRR